MFYRKFPPSAHLKDYIECYFVWEAGESLPSPLVIESPPNGFAAMVFHYGEPYRIQTPRQANMTVPEAFIAGQSTRSYHLHLSGKIGMVGIVFKPAAVGALFDLPMFEFTDERFDLQAVLGKPAEALHQRIGNTESVTEKIRLLESFVHFQFLKKNHSLTPVDFAANLLVEKQGNLNVETMMEQVWLSRRQLERRFLQQVGVSPKYYARLRRISYALSLMAGKRQICWQDIIYQCGFFDQAHFIKELTAFTGKAPTLYLRENTELAHYVGG